MGHVGVMIAREDRVRCEITYYISMAPEKAAKATPPPMAAFGPEFLARMAPAMKPAATGLTRSFFARYYVFMRPSDVRPNPYSCESVCGVSVCFSFGP